MPRINPVQNPTSEAQETLNGVNAKMGSVPNLFATLGHSNAALTGYLQLGDTLGSGVLTAAQREQIALAVAQENECEYCLSAHVVIGTGAGLTPDDIAAARRADEKDSIDSALTHLARTLVKQQGLLNDQSFNEYRTAGLSDAQIIETAANVALNTLTNYVNHLAETDIDFPVTRL